MGKTVNRSYLPRPGKPPPRAAVVAECDMLGHRLRNTSAAVDAEGRHHCDLGCIHLTDAEVDVLLGLCRGQTNAEIAADRGTARRTINNQVILLLHKFGVRDRTQLVILAFRAGLVEWPK